MQASRTLDLKSTICPDPDSFESLHHNSGKLFSSDWSPAVRIHDFYANVHQIDILAFLTLAPMNIVGNANGERQLIGIFPR